MPPPHDVVAAVARATGLDLRLVRALPGGEQGGALLVACGPGGHPDEARFVVTTQHEPWKVGRLHAAAPVMRAAVAGGWRAAAWVRTGPLPDGGAFVLQQHLEATPITALDGTTAHAVVAANRTQRGLGPSLGAAFDDAAQLLAVLSDHPWRAAVAARSGTGAAVVDQATRLHRRRGTTVLPEDDVVHGDASASNLLRDASGVVWCVDTETVGRGTRVRALADLVRQVRTAGGRATAGTHVLTDEARAVAGPAVFTTCIAAVSLDNLAWFAEHRSGPAFEAACGAVMTMLADLPD